MKSVLLGTMLTAILAVLLLQVFFLWGLTEYFEVFGWQQDTPASTLTAPSEFTGPIDEDPQAMWEGCVAANNNNAAEVCGPPPE